MKVLILNIVCALVVAAKKPKSFSGPEMRDFIRKNNYPPNARFRPQFHISAPKGWINEPSGFTYFNHNYHIFYQYHPYEGSWGPIHWGHAISSNLLFWNHYPAVLIPEKRYEKHGCLSGTAIPVHNHMNLFYTGLVRYINSSVETQNVAISVDGITYHKHIYNPILRPPMETFSFRNPKVWIRRNVWYMMVGKMNSNQNGQLLLYTSQDRFNWKYNGVLGKSYGDMGYLWENPDFFEIDGNSVLILSLQGVRRDGFRFVNRYQCVYIIGNLNYTTGRFENMEISTQTIYELDHGHDFYAAKTMKAPDGRILVIAWLGMWETKMPESVDGWAGMLTLVRELKLHPYKDGRLLMLPIEEMNLLRSEVLERAWYDPGEMFSADSKSFELIIMTKSSKSDVGITLEWKGGKYKILYSAAKGYVSVDRGGKDGERRGDWSPYGGFTIRVFVDVSSIEVFCGEGEVVFTSRIYPQKIRVTVIGDTTVYITQYRISRAIGFDLSKNTHARDSPLDYY